MVPPTSASVPGGALAWAALRTGPLMSARAASEVGSLVRTTLYDAVCLSGLSCAWPTWPTPWALPRSAAYVVVSLSVSGLPSVEWSSTTVGSVAPGGKPFSRVFRATADSTVLGAPESPRSKLGLNCRAKIASTARTSPEAAAYTAGRRPRDWPIAPKRAKVGSFFHAFDGQNTLVPIRETTAGTNVSAATTVTATAIASAGPIDLKMPSELRISAMNDTITAPPAEMIASPARVIACATAALCSSPRRSRSR